jgi:ElaA protein
VTIHWKYVDFESLSLRELYAVLALRSRVFVVEQNSVYLDIDGLDASAKHLLGLEDDQLVAYLRILPPGARFPDRTVGRVIVDPRARRSGLGLELVREGLRQLFQDLGGPVPTSLAAQAHLEKFYGAAGYERTAREPFLEDGIAHVDMHRPAVPLAAAPLTP